MREWLDDLKYDPIVPLLESNNDAIIYFTRRDLLAEKVASVEHLWNLVEPQEILRKQKEEGYWKSNSQNRTKAPAVNYDLFETFKQFSKLIDMYEFNKKHKLIAKAAEYILSCQTDEGDIRGIIGNQYAPYYTGLIMSHLIKAGYGDDQRIDKGFKWLLKMRQNDGGWVIGTPGGFGDYAKDEYNKLTTHDVGTKKDFDKEKPFAHSGTGMVIRAFAVHKKNKNTKAAKKAADLLKSHFFKKDNYKSYQAIDNWVNFKFPFFWTDLISALDSVTLILTTKGDEEVEKAIDWIHRNQQETGLWKNSYSKIHKSVQNKKTYNVQLWISLSICRILKRYYGS